MSEHPEQPKVSTLFQGTVVKFQIKNFIHLKTTTFSIDWEFYLLLTLQVSQMESSTIERHKSVCNFKFSIFLKDYNNCTCFLFAGGNSGEYERRFECDGRFL